MKKSQGCQIPFEAVIEPTALRPRCVLMTPLQGNDAFGSTSPFGTKCDYRATLPSVLETIQLTAMFCFRWDDSTGAKNSRTIGGYR